VTIARMPIESARAQKRRRFAQMLTADTEREDWLNAKMLRSGEVAVLLQMSRRAVTEWARTGRLPFILTPGGHRRFRARDVRELVDVMHAPLSEQQRPSVGRAARG
jgi:excisionase family DNA binding protein